MKTKKIKILAIESSCDETAAAVIEGDFKGGNPRVLSNIVSSQVDIHAKTGGVVPEVASRAHVEVIVPVVTEALIQAQAQGNNKELQLDQESYALASQLLNKEITHIAYTAGPGLIGSLLVGYNAAKAISCAASLPIIPINHIEGHIFSALINKMNEDPKFTVAFPLITLTVSGGHTSLTLIEAFGKYKNIGHTLDDAAGEAFDKVAKLLDLGYPGGPIVSKWAQDFRMKNMPNPFTLPRPIINDGTLNFSFSGLKTAVLQTVINIGKERELTIADKQAICAAFEDAAVDVLTTKSMNAIEQYQPKTFILAGGVAANAELRRVMEEKLSKLEINFFVPPLSLCGDNAAMIGVAAFFHAQKGDVSTWSDAPVDSNMEL